MIQQLCEDKMVCEGVAESKRLHHTILQASKAMIGQIIADVVAGFKLFVSVAEQQGHLRG